MTSIGLLLGVSAAKLGTMDMSVTRLLSIHVPALLPPTSTELDVPHSVQVAAVVGIGLVYQGTGHRHNAEVLLAEIGQYTMGSVCMNVIWMCVLVIRGKCCLNVAGKKLQCSQVCLHVCV